MGNMINMVNWNTIELELKHSIYSNEHAMCHRVAHGTDSRDSFVYC